MELKIGSSGSSVTQIQTILNNLGIDVGVADGIFGQKTYEGVRKFQLTKGLNATGIVNDLTISKLKTAMANKNSLSSNPINGGNMLTNYIDKIKSNKLYLGAAIAGLAGVSFLIYKKVKK